MSDERVAPAAWLQPSASYSFTMRLHLPQRGDAFARVAHAIVDRDRAHREAVQLLSCELPEFDSLGSRVGPPRTRHSIMRL